jgi:hypothetical protein
MLISTVVQWYSGTVVQWYSGTVVQCYSVKVVQWYSGTVVQWYSVTVLQCYIVHRSIVYMRIGPRQSYRHYAPYAPISLTVLQCYRALQWCAVVYFTNYTVHRLTQVPTEGPILLSAATTITITISHPIIHPLCSHLSSSLSHYSVSRR